MFFEVKHVELSETQPQAKQRPYFFVFISHYKLRKILLHSPTCFCLKQKNKNLVAFCFGDTLVWLYNFIWQNSSDFIRQL